jgi:hypothetical protein
MSFRGSWRHQAGIGVVTALIAATVIGIMLAGLTIFVNAKIKERRVQSAADGRRFAWDFLMINAGSPDSLRASMLQGGAGNLMLRACVQAGGALCTATTPATSMVFNLYAPMSAGSTIQLTGADQTVNAGHYSHRGLRTNAPASPLVPYWGQARFFATCPGAASGGTCAQASRIYVTVSVQKITTVTNMANIPGVNFDHGPYPRIADVNAALTVGARDSSRFVARTWSSDILGGNIQECPKFTYMYGVDDDGIIQCKCEQGFRQIGTQAGSRYPICTPIDQCPTGTMMAGMAADGSATCRVPPPAVQSCWNSGAVGSWGNVSCPNLGGHNFWRMRRLLIANECHIDGADHVVCPDLQITCCRDW